MDAQKSPLFGKATDGLDRIAREREEALRNLTPEAAAEIARRLHSGPRPVPIDRDCGLIERQNLLRRLG